MVMKGAVRTVRDHRGTKFQLSCYSVPELRVILDNAFTSADQIVRFTEQVCEELAR